MPTVLRLLTAVQIGIFSFFFVSCSSQAEPPASEVSPPDATAEKKEEKKVKEPDSDIESGKDGIARQKTKKNWKPYNEYDYANPQDMAKAKANAEDDINTNRAEEIEFLEKSDRESTAKKEKSDALDRWIEKYDGGK